MKLHLLLPTLLLSACAAFAADESDMLEFVTNPDFAKLRETGGLKTNTFYWSNTVEKPVSPPTAGDDNGKPFLQIAAKYPDVALSSVIQRVVTVPSGVTTLNVKMSVKYEVDAWEKFTTATLPWVECYFIADGKISRLTQPAQT